MHFLFHFISWSLNLFFHKVLENSAVASSNPLEFIWKLLITLLTNLLRNLLLIFDKYFEIFANEMYIEDDRGENSRKQWIIYSRLCDKKLTGYVLNKKMSTQAFSNQMDDCGLPFFAQKVNNFHLIQCVIKVILSNFYIKIICRFLILISFLSS